jgi:ATP-dependent helicase/nuclease subunit B
MPVTRHFLDWRRPTDSVADWLWARRAQTPGPDLSAWLVLVPTRQAGRRLRHRLAALAETAGGVLLPPVVQTPPVFWSARADAARDAGPRVEAAVWKALLEQAPAPLLRPLFPAWDGRVPGGQAGGVTDLLQRLRRTVAEAGLTLADAAGQLGCAAESERWEALARLESLYLQALAAHGLEDSVAREIRLARAPELPAAIREIALAALPDPTPLLLRALERLGEDRSVQVLVAAPAARADDFDAWGRPRPEHWVEAVIDLPDPASTLHLAPDPAAQARAAAERLLAAPGEAALGTPDPALLPHLAVALEAHGLRLRDTAGAPVARHPLTRLVRLLADAAENPDYPALREVFRQADALAALATVAQADPDDLVHALDLLQNAHLPRDLDDVRRVAADSPHLPAPLRLPLAAALTHLARWLERLRGEDPATVLPELLAEIFAVRQLDPTQPADALFAEVAAGLRAGWEDLRRPVWTGLGLPPLDRLRLLLDHWEGSRVPLAPDPLARDAEGWLELAWHPAPTLVLTGLQEGIVPGGELSDPFLPDAARQRLGLRHDAARLARDAYLLTALLESRRGSGCVHLLCARTGRDNDPLRPSRLLLRCPPDQLAARCRQLFGGHAPAGAGEAARLPFRLEFAPEDLPAEVPDVHSVSDFKTFLTCPFFFFLRRIVRLGEPGDDQRRELSAPDFGTLAHTCLRAFAREATVRASPDPAVITAFLHGELQRHLHTRFGPRPTLAVEYQADSLRQRFQTFARRQAERTRAGWTLLAGEVQVETVVGDARLRGVIDRVDLAPDGRRLCVLDYKTGDKPRAPREAHVQDSRDSTRFGAFTAPDKDKPARWADLQLPLYARLAAVHWNRAPEEVSVGYIQLPAALGEIAFAEWEGFGPAWIDAAFACAEEVRAAIRERAFLDFRGYPEREHDPYLHLFFGDPAGAVDLDSLRLWGAVAPDEPPPT